MNRVARVGWYLLLGTFVFVPHLGRGATVSQLDVAGVAFAACEVDLRKDRLAMHWKSDTGAVYGSLRSLSDSLRERGKTLVCGSNGGIFDEAQKPLGLYIEHGMLMRRVNRRRSGHGNFYLQPNGVFVLYSDRGEIVTTEEYVAKPDDEKRSILFANQSGPILLRDGVVNPLFTPGSANLTTRNAVCMRAPQTVVLVAALDPISFHGFAVALKNSFQCRSALYLDGSVSNFYPATRAQFARPLGILLAVTIDAAR